MEQIGSIFNGTAAVFVVAFVVTNIAGFVFGIMQIFSKKRSMRSLGIGLVVFFGILGVLVGFNYGVQSTFNVTAIYFTVLSFQIGSLCLLLIKLVKMPTN